MSTTVTLQERIAMSPWPFVLIVLGIAGIVLLFLVPYLKSKQPSKPAVQQPAFVPPTITVPQDKYSVKSRYMTVVDTIQRDLQTGLIDDRKAAQALSMVVRDFVNEMTGINVRNYTLTEIKLLNMPELADLIEGYYAPEFSKKKGWNSQKSIEKTKRAISKWT